MFLRPVAASTPFGLRTLLVVMALAAVGWWAYWFG